MAIYHVSHGAVTRSTGRSSVQSAAYISGLNLHETWRNIPAFYPHQVANVVYTKTLAPHYAPEWAKDVKEVWNRLEEFEDFYADQYFKTDRTRKNHKDHAQLAQTIVIALPREFPVEISREAIEELIEERFISRGLIVTYGIHKDEGNPHAHIQISRRRIDENGEFSWTKDREICKKSYLRGNRKFWADIANRYLELLGYEERITEKSFLELGIKLLPTKHRGWIADKLLGKPIQSRIIFDNQQIILENRKMLLEQPEIILQELTALRATFNQKDLLKAIQKRMGDEDDLVAQVFEGALQGAIVVGEGVDGLTRYTSASYQQLEEKAVEQTQQLALQPYRQDITQEGIDQAFALSEVSLNEEQQQAVRGLVADQQLAVLVGRAGAGKTTSLKVVADIYQQAGHQMIGTSLAALAADNLGTEAQIQSRTLESWLCRWRSYEEAKEKFLSFDHVITEG